jgi:hypothetical protein
MRQLVRKAVIACSVGALILWVVEGLDLPGWTYFVAAFLAGMAIPPRVFDGPAHNERRTHVNASVLGAMLLGARTVDDIRRTSGRGGMTVSWALSRLLASGDIVCMWEDEDGGLLRAEYYITTKNARVPRQPWEPL